MHPEIWRCALASCPYFGMHNQADARFMPFRTVMLLQLVMVHASDNVQYSRHCSGCRAVSAGTCCLSCLCTGFVQDGSSPNLRPCRPAIVCCRVLLPDDLQRQLGQHAEEQVVHLLLPRPPGHLHSTCRLSQIAQSLLMSPNFGQLQNRLT